jgi:multidrug efflux pump subunit AcrA (membrane-fusion protein)
MMPTGPGTQPTQTMQLPAQPPGEQSTGRRRRWLRWAVPLLAFLLGACVGGVGDRTDVTSTPQYLTLQEDLQVAQDEAGELSDEVTAAEGQIQAATAAAEARLAEQTAAITQRSTALDQREQELAARESGLRAAEVARGSSAGSASSAGSTSSSASSSSGSSSSSSGSVASGAGSAPVVEPERELEPPVGTSYDNCSAARAAGAAPVRAGDPGYGRHLDRDGDGVGCE